MARKELTPEEVKRLLPPSDMKVDWGFTQNGWLVWQEEGKTTQARGLAWSPSRRSSDCMYMSGLKVPIERDTCRPGEMGEGGIVTEAVPSSGFGKKRRKGVTKTKQGTLPFKRPEVQMLISQLTDALELAKRDLESLSKLVH